MTYAVVRVNPLARCSSCGAPYKAFDFKVEIERPDGEITHICRNCHTKIVEIELSTSAPKESA
jgi:hypothetical protein